MQRVLLPLLIAILGAALVALAIVLWRSGDPAYTAEEWMHRERYARFDRLIADAARKHHFDPMLIKAIVWRESKFSPEKKGTSGERGLMQVGEAAAQDWAKAEKIETFAPTDLFDPKVNLEVGVWYLSKAAEHWKEKEDSTPFLLAEYNAGKRRVDRWVHESGKADQAQSPDLMRWIDFPTTRRYIEDIVARQRFYQQRGRL